MSTLKFELLPFIDPRTAEITEAMLVPGSKWRHKETGEVAGLRKWRDTGVFLVSDKEAMVGPDGCRVQLRGEMLAWLRDEYVPADATLKPLTVGDLPVKAVFDAKSARKVLASDWSSERHLGRGCIDLATGAHHHVPNSWPVTRVHGILKTTEE